MTFPKNVQHNFLDHFWEKILFGACARGPQSQKTRFGKNTKWPPAVLVVNKFFWSKDESGPLWEDSAGVQNPEPFLPIMTKFWPFIIFAIFRKLGIWHFYWQKIFFSNGARGAQ